MTNGNVTSIGLHIRPQPKKNKASHKNRDGRPVTGDVTGAAFPAARPPPLVPCFAYASNASSAKNVLNTSLRSEIQATDSTCKGCNANRAAANRPGHKETVSRDMRM